MLYPAFCRSPLRHNKGPFHVARHSLVGTRHVDFAHLRSSSKRPGPISRHQRSEDTMGKVIVEQIVSLDGYAEDADGGIDFFVNANWINEADTEQLRMLSGVAAIVFGAKTYRMFADYWPSADPAAEPVATPIRELPKFVVSSTLESAPWG